VRHVTTNPTSFINALFYLHEVTTSNIILGKGKVVSVLFLTKHHAMEAYWGSGSTAPYILDLGTRWR
jgi:hypothetical protein